MELKDFDAIRILMVDRRVPQERPRIASMLSDHHGLFISEPFIVGKGQILPEKSYDFIDPTMVPSTWQGFANSYCAFKAYQTLFQRLLDTGVESVLILEDDCEFTENFDAIMSQISIPNYWDMIYLGGNYQLAQSTRVQQYLYKTRGIVCWHAVAIHSRLFEEIVSWKPIHPIDAQCIPIHDRGATYGVFPSVAIQQAGFSHVEGRYRDYSEFWSIKP